MEVKQKTVEEVIEYWSQFHDKDKLSHDDFGDNMIARLCIGIALEMRRDSKLEAIIIAMIKEFDKNSFIKMASVTNSYTKLAEQIHLYFLGKEEQLEGLFEVLKISNEDDEE